MSSRSSLRFLRVSGTAQILWRGAVPAPINVKSCEPEGPQDLTEGLSQHTRFVSSAGALVAASRPEIGRDRDADAPRDGRDRVGADRGSGEEPAQRLGGRGERLI